MDENNIIDALNTYDGTQPSLEKTVGVLSQELGPNWTEEVFQKLGGLSVELKEKLDHVFNYYASLTAWQEAQSYLDQEEPLNPEVVEERLPVLKHWLSFFGDAGQNLYQQLEDRYYQESESETQEVDNSGSEDTGEDSSVSSPEEEPLESDVTTVEDQETFAHEPEEEVQEEVIPGEGQSISDEGPVVDEIANVPEETQKIEEEKLPSQENSSVIDQAETMESSFDGFPVQKAMRSIQLLDGVQAWVAARCIELGNIEIYAYPYFGMVVDMMRQTVKDIQAVLALDDAAMISKYSSEGIEYFTRKKQAIESDIERAVENCESDTTALIEKGMDLEKVKKTLGDLDNSEEKEYLGPAPDGFELMEDAPIDEEVVKEQYQQLEEQVKENNQNDISVAGEKKASQTEQNNVQRKLSFSLKPKKG